MIATVMTAMVVMVVEITEAELVAELVAARHLGATHRGGCATCSLLWRPPASYFSRRSSSSAPCHWRLPVRQSGGRPIQFLYECMGQTLAGPAGAHPRFGHQRDDRLATFAPYPRVSKARYVNVDTTNKRGVQRAREWGLVPSGLADIIVTHDPKYALENLFDRRHKGRIFALFRRECPARRPRTPRRRSPRVIANDARSFWFLPRT